MRSRNKRCGRLSRFGEHPIPEARSIWYQREFGIKAVTSTKAKVFVAVLVMLVAVATVSFLAPQISTRVARSPAGHVVTLEAWNFQTNRVRYDLPNRPWARRLEKWLPNWVSRRIGLSKPTLSVV